MALKAGQSAMTVYLATDLLIRLKQLANKEGRSLSSYVARQLSREESKDISKNIVSRVVRDDFDQSI
jgi:cytidylate kinase